MQNIDTMQNLSEHSIKIESFIHSHITFKFTYPPFHARFVNFNQSHANSPPLFRHLGINPTGATKQNSKTHPIKTVYLNVKA